MGIKTAPAGTILRCATSRVRSSASRALRATQARARERAYVKMATGLVKDMKTTTIDGQSVTILADADAQLDRDGDGPVLVVTGAGAVVKIYDLKINGATGASGADGIQLTANGGNPSLILTRVTIDGNQGNGITATGGTLTVSQSIISANDGGGIVMTGSGTLFTIRNNFIFKNGNSLTASVGGLSLVPTGASIVEFNTIVDNQAKVAGTSAGG